MEGGRSRSRNNGRRIASGHRLFQVSNQILPILQTHGQTRHRVNNHVLRNSSSVRP
jgi:hypothetical protein